MPGPLLEICVDSVTGLRAAKAGGADRVELCSALALGGLTPGPGLIAAAQATGLPVAAMARSRAGGFVYAEDEIAAVLTDIRVLVDAGVNAVVVGAVSVASALDRDALARMVDAAGTCPVVLHRAIDLTPDPVGAVEIAFELGIQRILTSGGAQSAPEGCAQIARMVAQSAGRIEIMAGGGVRPGDVAGLLAAGVDAVHGSASGPADLCGADRIGVPEYAQTQVETVRAMRKAVAAG